jgi:hypothetical protein
MRPTSPWYRKSKDKWYVEVGGKQPPLGRHPESAPPPKKGRNGWNVPPEIMTAYHRLMAADPANVPKPDAVRICSVCDLFLEWSAKHHKPDTYSWCNYFLQDFCEKYGLLPAAEVKPLHITRWLDSHEKWSGGQRNAVVCVKRVFNWAHAEGLIASNPLVNVRKPRQKARTRIVTPAERKEILAAARPGGVRRFDVREGDEAMKAMPVPAANLVLLRHHLATLHLPTVKAECEQVARQCASEGIDHLGFLSRLCERDLGDRGRRASAR